MSIRCPRCGAALPVDLEMERARCGYCRQDEPLDPAVLQRARQHVAAVESLLQIAADFEVTTRYLSVLHRVFWAGTMLVAGDLVLTIAAFEGRSLLGPGARVPLLAVASLLGAATLVVAIVVEWARSRRPSADVLAPGRADCPVCGASVPIHSGRTTSRCPFCDSHLAPDAATMTRFEEAAGRRFDGRMREAAAAGQALEAGPAFGPDRHGERMLPADERARALLLLYSMLAVLLLAAALAGSRAVLWGGFAFFWFVLMIVTGRLRN